MVYMYTTYTWDVGGENLMFSDLVGTSLDKID